MINADILLVDICKELLIILYQIDLSNFDCSGSNVPPISLSNVPGIAESNVPSVAVSNVLPTAE